MDVEKTESGFSFSNFAGRQKKACKEDYKKEDSYLSI